MMGRHSILDKFFRRALDAGGQEFHEDHLVDLGLKVEGAEDDEKGHRRRDGVNDDGLLKVLGGVSPKDVLDAEGQPWNST